MAREPGKEGPKQKAGVRIRLGQAGVGNSGKTNWGPKEGEKIQWAFKGRGSAGPACDPQKAKPA